MNLIRAVVLILAVVVVSSCKKDEIISPTGTYNVTTQEGSNVRIGTMSITGKYTFTFDPYAGAYGPLTGTITAGVIDIPVQTHQSATYQGYGSVSDEGSLSMDFTLINWGTTYKVKVQGNRAK